MHFSLVDRIVALDPDGQIEAVKALSMAEEYLGDHFPGFPVMPGVLMLEALTQTSAWLVRVREDFAHSVVVLKEARNVKYGQFVEPGQTLRMQAKIIKETESETVVQATGSVDGQTTVKAKLVLERFNLADRGEGCEATDRLVKGEMRNAFRLIRPQTASAAPMPTN